MKMQKMIRMNNRGIPNEENQEKKQSGKIGLLFSIDQNMTGSNRQGRAILYVTEQEKGNGGNI